MTIRSQNNNMHIVDKTHYTHISQVKSTTTARRRKLDTTKNTYNQRKKKKHRQKERGVGEGGRTVWVVVDSKMQIEKEKNK